LALPCGQFVGRYDYLKEMGELVDFANMMCYDFTGPKSPVSDHHSNLFSRHVGNYSADAGIKELLATGFPARKTILGIPIYGRGFDGCQNLTKTFAGPSVGTWGEPGVIDYKSLNLRNGTCTPLIEIVTNGTFCHDSKFNRILVYDSATAVQRKVKYVKQLGLAGVMFWESSADIYTDPRDGLIAAARASLAPFTLDRQPANLCYPNSTYANINSLQNCTLKTAPNVGEFVAKPVAPVDLERVARAVPFGSRIHAKIN
jgi:chitinase